jgi:hypothetical protein
MIVNREVIAGRSIKLYRALRTGKMPTFAGRKPLHFLANRKREEVLAMSAKTNIRKTPLIDY